MTKKVQNLTLEQFLDNLKDHEGQKTPIIQLKSTKIRLKVPKKSINSHFCP